MVKTAIIGGRWWFNELSSYRCILFGLPNISKQSTGGHSRCRNIVPSPLLVQSILTTGLPPRPWISRIPALRRQTNLVKSDFKPQGALDGSIKPSPWVCSRSQISIPTLRILITTQAFQVDVMLDVNARPDLVISLAIGTLVRCHDRSQLFRRRKGVALVANVDLRGRAIRAVILLPRCRQVLGREDSNWRKRCRQHSAGEIELAPRDDRDCLIYGRKNLSLGRDSMKGSYLQDKSVKST